MTSLVSSFTTWVAGSGALPGLVAAGLFLLFLVGADAVRAFYNDRPQWKTRSLRVVIIPLGMVFATSMIVWLITLIQ